MGPRRLWAGLDLGVETTSICVIDDAGLILQQTVCPSRLECIHEQLWWLRRRKLARLSLEATSSFSIARGLQSLGYAVDLYETRQLSKFLRVRRNKTDAGDAIGIAEAGRVGGTLLSKVFLKTFECQALQSRLTFRDHLIRQRVATMNLVCRQLEQYGGRVTGAKKSRRFAVKIEAEIRKVFGRHQTPLTVGLHQLLDRWRELLSWQAAIDRELTRVALENDVCRRFMEVPGVGPLCALAFYAAVGDPHRFSRSADIGSYFGLTPKVHQSGLSCRSGRITRMGNKKVRSLLSRAASIATRATAPESELRNWAKRIEERRGRGRARVALARKLAVIMISMWKSGQEFQPTLTTKAPSPPPDNPELRTPLVPIRTTARADCLGRPRRKSLDLPDNSRGGEPRECAADASGQQRADVGA